MTKVGEVIGPRTFMPSPRPWVSVVLPAPRSPVSTTRSPGRRRAPRRRPRSCMAVAVATGVSTTGPAWSGITDMPPPYRAAGMAIALSPDIDERCHQSGLGRGPDGIQLGGSAGVADTCVVAGGEGDIL